MAAVTPIGDSEALRLIEEYEIEMGFIPNHWVLDISTASLFIFVSFDGHTVSKVNRATKEVAIEATWPH